MKSTVTLVLFLFTATAQASQFIDKMYVNTFGDPANQALVFVHGGPGYDSWNFELTTAPALAARGYYVVVYDERGQGRSEPAPLAVYNYKSYADDLQEILTALNIKNPVLLAHSHGGPISISFDKYYPGVVKRIVLISATVNFGKTVQTEAQNASVRLKSKGNDADLNTLATGFYDAFENPDASNAQKTSGIATIFTFGLSSGLYYPHAWTKEAKALYTQLDANPIQGQYDQNYDNAGEGFFQNEPFLSLNLLPYVAANSSHFCGVYGADDGLFSTLELAELNFLLKPAFRVIEDASHNVFMDQQNEFFAALRETCGL